MMERNQILNLPGIGPEIIDRLEDNGYQSVEDIQQASFHELTSIKGIGSNTAVYLTEYLD